MAKPLGVAIPPLKKSAYADTFGVMKKTAQIFKALSDETRLRLLALLKDGEICVCDLMAVLDLPQSTVSRHLAYLRNAGLVEDRRQGVWMFYRLSSGASPFEEELLSLLAVHLDQIDQVRKDQATLNRLGIAKTKNCR